MNFQVDDLFEKGKAAANLAKNFVLNYTETEIKVREATNNDHWGPSGTSMADLASLSQKYDAFGEIMSTIYKRFTEPGKTWRQIYKSLILLEYLIKNGSERVAEYASDHIYEVKALMHYNHIDEKGKDQGINVRNRSKEIVLLLQDPARIQEERSKAQSTKNKYFSVSSEESRSSMGLSSGTPSYDSRDDFRSGSSRALNDDYDTPKPSKSDTFKNIQFQSSGSGYSGPIPQVASPGGFTPQSRPAQTQSFAPQSDPFGPPAAATHDDFGDFASAQGNDFGTFESATPAPIKNTPAPIKSAPAPSSSFNSSAPMGDFFSATPQSSAPQNNFDILTGDILAPASLMAPEPVLVPQSQKGSSSSSSSTQASQKSEQWGSGLVNLDNLKKYDTGKEKKEHRPMGPTSGPSRPASTTPTSSFGASPMFAGAQPAMGGAYGGAYGAQPAMGGMYGAQPAMGGAYGAQPAMGGMYAQPGMYGAQPQAGIYGRPPAAAGYPQQMGGYPGQQMGGYPQRK